MKRPFQIGDRVRVYGTDGNFKLVMGTGTVEGFTAGGSPLFADGHSLTNTGQDGSYYDLTMPHPKQCRRLVKKPLRRVWLPPMMGTCALSFTSLTRFWDYLLCKTPGNNFTEFVEVRRNK